uniref:Uncharacterized protein n=1 Tax=Arundo donax TaxID=35708 RepID=A0A0A9ST27_ARUDO
MLVVQALVQFLCKKVKQLHSTVKLWVLKLCLCPPMRKKL